MSIFNFNKPKITPEEEQQKKVIKEFAKAVKTGEPINKEILNEGQVPRELTGTISGHDTFGMGRFIDYCLKHDKNPFRIHRKGKGKKDL